MKKASVASEGASACVRGGVCMRQRGHLQLHASEGASACVTSKTYTQQVRRPLRPFLSKALCHKILSMQSHLLIQKELNISQIHNSR